MKTLFLLSLLHVVIFSADAQSAGNGVFTESDIVLHSATGDIYGSLVVPVNQKSSPVVLIVAGSGATDRDCNSPAGLQTDAYKMLAHGFAENGISSLRFDKRGVARSNEALTSEYELRFEDYVNDVVYWIALLENDKRFSSIHILGHSEGSLIGMIAANKVAVDGFISIAGAGKSADKILEEQLKTKLPAQLLAESDNILDSLRVGKTVSKVSPLLMALYRPNVQPYMISWIKYDPADEIGRLKIPILIIQGTTDLQVGVADADLLAKANPSATLLVLNNMNHVLKESESDIMKNMETYRNPALPLKDGLVKGIVDFVSVNNK